MGIALMVIGGVLMFFLMKKPAYAIKAASPIESSPAYQSVDSIIAENVKRYGVEEALIRAIIRTESSFDPNAINKEGTTDRTRWSYGLMQVQLAVGEDFGIVRDYRNPTEAEIAMLMTPSTNVRVGTWNIKRWLDKYSFDEAVQIYNVGETGYTVKGYRNADYLAKVKRFYNEYKSD